MPNPMNWPVELPDVQVNDPLAEVKKALLQGQIDMLKVDKQHAIDTEKAFWDNEYKLAEAVQNAYLDVAKGQLERSNSAAEFVQKAASAIATVYTGILGLSFAVGQGKLVPLPSRGVAAAVFLGTSIFLATAFRAYITKPAGTVEENSGDLIPDIQRSRRNTFIEWAQRGPLSRELLLQMSVISLGIGVMCLPLPYIEFGDQRVLYQVIPIGLAVTIVLPLFVRVAPRVLRYLRSE